MISIIAIGASVLIIYGLMLVAGMALVLWLYDKGVKALL